MTRFGNKKTHGMLIANLNFYKDVDEVPKRTLTWYSNQERPKRKEDRPVSVPLRSWSLVKRAILQI